MSKPPTDRANPLGRTKKPGAAASEASESPPGAASGSGPGSSGLTGPSGEAPSATKARGACLDTQAPTVAPSADSSVEVPQPLRISAYKILSVLGEGGMGVVYRAEQDNPRREVALKLLKAGGASAIALSRFKEEAQILGRLQHPGIAQIFEAGTADTGFGPQPFFAMEFIHGVPLKAHVDSNRLSLRSRLELMIKVCEGVHHAHQKGVIHRDLKPGNILVDESGQPKILDFGIALLADRDGSAAAQPGEQEQLAGTVPYMSIEQFSGDPHEIDTRSDVYSLGVIFYQLLAGRLPFDLHDKTIPQARHVVNEQEPPPLGVLNRSCRGDIESIVRKALEKEKARRYQSASDLAADMRRFLNDEPVLACAPTRAYLFRKFAKRNRALLAGFLTTIAALSIGLIQATTERNRAVEAETLAREEAAHAQAEEANANTVLQLLLDAIESVEPRISEGEDVTIASVFGELASRVASKELSDTPELEAKVLLTLGKTYRALAFPERAWKYLEAAVTFYESAHGSNDVDTLEARAEQALVLENRGEVVEAEALCRQTLASARSRLGDQHPVTIETMQNLGYILQGRGRFAEAATLYRQAVRLAPRETTGDNLRILVLQNDLAMALKEQGEIKTAELLYRRILRTLRQEYSMTHPYALTTEINLAQTLVEQGQFDSAKTLFQETLILCRQVFGYDHPRTFSVVNSLASLLRKQGKTSEAKSLYTEVLDALHRKFGRDHLKTMPTLHNLASLLKENGELVKAEQLFRRILSVRLAKLGPDHPSVLATMNNLAGLLKERRKLDQAESLYRDVLDAYRRAENEDSDQAQTARHNLACVLHDQGKDDEDKGKLEEAEQYYIQSIDYYQRKFGEEHLRTTGMKFALAKLLADMGDDTRAAELHREVLETRRQRFSGREPDIARSLFELGDVFLRLGDAVKAEAWLRESLAIRRTHYASDDYRTANAENALGASLTALGRFDEAETLLVQSLPIIESRYGADGKRTKTAKARLADLFRARATPREAAGARSEPGHPD